MRRRPLPYVNPWGDKDGFIRLVLLCRVVRCPRPPIKIGEKEEDMNQRRNPFETKKE